MLQLGSMQLQGWQRPKAFWQNSAPFAYRPAAGSLWQAPPFSAQAGWPPVRPSAKIMAACCVSLLFRQTWAQRLAKRNFHGNRLFSEFIIQVLPDCGNSQRPIPLKAQISFGASPHFFRLFSGAAKLYDMAICKYARRGKAAAASIPIRLCLRYKSGPLSHMAPALPFSVNQQLRAGKRLFAAPAAQAKRADSAKRAKGKWLPCPPAEANGAECRLPR